MRLIHQQSSYYDRYDDESAQYSLSSSIGSKLWTDCNAHQVIKSRPDEIYKIALQYCDILKIYGSYLEYESCFGFGSFYEEVSRLSYSDGNLVKALYEYAMPVTDKDKLYPMMKDIYTPHEIDLFVKYKWSEVPFTFYSSSQKDECLLKSEQYLFNHKYKYGGSSLVPYCEIFKFITENPNHIYDIAKKYSQSLQIATNYKKYEMCFGFDAFYEYILCLAYHNEHLIKDL